MTAENPLRQLADVQAISAKLFGERLDQRGRLLGPVVAERQEVADQRDHERGNDRQAEAGAAGCTSTMLVGSGEPIDLAAFEVGGRALHCSDEHYGSMHNLNLPGRGINMGDGWETARRRGPGHDWVIIALGQPGVIERAEVDTAHFKGNYPDRVSLEGAMFDSDDAASNDSPEWRTLLAESKLKMDQQHYFDDTLEEIGPVSHVRVSIYPDGGISRVRLFGQVHG